MENLIIDDSDECVICLTEYNEGEICKISESFLEKSCECKYYIHKECLQNWINMHDKNMCLMCKERVILKETCCKKYNRLIRLKRNQKIICKFVSYLFLFSVLIYFAYIFYGVLFVEPEEEYSKVS